MSKYPHTFYQGSSLKYCALLDNVTYFGRTSVGSLTVGGKQKDELRRLVILRFKGMSQTVKGDLDKLLDKIYCGE